MQRRLFIFLVIALILSSAAIAASHHHDDGELHQDCPVCITAHNALSACPASASFGALRQVAIQPCFRDAMHLSSSGTAFSVIRPPPFA